MQKDHNEICSWKDVSPPPPLEKNTTTTSINPQLTLWKFLNPTYTNSLKNCLILSTLRKKVDGRGENYALFEENVIISGDVIATQRKNRRFH